MKVVDVPVDPNARQDRLLKILPMSPIKKCYTCIHVFFDGDLDSTLGNVEKPSSIRFRGTSSPHIVDNEGLSRGVGLWYG